MNIRFFSIVLIASLFLFLSASCSVEDSDDLSDEINSGTDSDGNGALPDNSAGDEQILPGDENGLPDNEDPDDDNVIPGVDSDGDESLMMLETQRCCS